ncbi:hypothetical protein DFP94_101480 [Fontibacillus phaseoli]|uniref:Uncharacterized protein n=1 Tax=Fontibacillus phaseoli TaxID=1416533 RepID=A0A369BNC1_9BACL|nr:hypothetical protein [Fontibacillus phaseoli]RCX22891.1 hypothetical protein DFP94_101480 [Fontibacillus phaseoli]
MARPKITAEQREDWRNLPLANWNTRTVHAMVIDLNAEKFGIEKYVPLRGWAFEQGVIKRALNDYGAAALRETIERAFAEYKPGAQYPQLTAGFLIAYMLPRIMPQVLAEGQRKEKASAAVVSAMSAEEMASWL